MIRIDRNASTPLHTQLADQLRFEIANGRYRVGERLPSTRELGKQLDLSFHTVRKVYQELERDGYVESRPGAGYVVTDRGPVSKEERMERGASIAHDALKRMISLGLSDADIDYLFQEQRSLLEGSTSPAKVVFAGAYLEMAERCADHVAEALQLDVEPSTIGGLVAHTDADYVLVPFRDVKRAMQALPQADTVGMIVSLPVGTLEALARQSAEATVAIVVRDDDAIQPLMQEIRTATAFAGQVVGLSIHENADELTRRLAETDLVLATPACVRRLRSRVSNQRLHLADPTITEASLRRVRTILPH